MGAGESSGPPSGTIPSHSFGHETRTGIGFSAQGINSATTHHSDFSAADAYHAKTASSAGSWNQIETRGGGGGQAYNWTGTGGDGQAYGGRGYTDPSGSTTISDAWKMN
eukprot:TRINITY_DN51705_c0_g1_i1.p1 TRINITY_DN51705_c0_g1~~TRINITY_DN51705_c0_g1_i1.p1  ORF type:complete len:109 (+),score=19.66 TRINITY_DN51705_c0_g1_i1:66-392(+)